MLSSVKCARAFRCTLPRRQKPKPKHEINENNDADPKPESVEIGADDSDSNSDDSDVEHECGARVRTVDRMRAHISVVHLAYWPFECSLCATRLPTERRLTQHCRREHHDQPHCSHKLHINLRHEQLINELVSKYVDPVEEKDESIIPTAEWYRKKVEDAKREVEVQTISLVRYDTYAPPPPPPRPQGFGWKNGRIYKGTHPLKNCEICGKEVSIHRMSIHNRNHDPATGPFQCAVCPQTYFVSKVALLSHGRRDHVEIEPSQRYVDLAKFGHKFKSKDRKIDAYRRLVKNKRIKKTNSKYLLKKPLGRPRIHPIGYRYPRRPKPSKRRPVVAPDVQSPTPSRLTPNRSTPLRESKTPKTPSSLRNGTPKPHRSASTSSRRSSSTASARSASSCHSERPYIVARVPCKVCHRLIAWSRLQVHMRSHDPSTGEFTCVHCPMTYFVSRSALLIHRQRVHQPGGMYDESVYGGPKLAAEP